MTKKNDSADKKPSVKKEFNKNAQNKPLVSGHVKETNEKRPRLKGQRFLITSAQNNTYIHEGFLKSMESYCEKNGAQLLVSPFSYNKNGFINSTVHPGDDGQWYDPKIVKYLVREQSQVADGLVFCAELNILPTAVNPLSGFENYTKSQSGIIPHATQAMQSLPGMKEDGARFLYSTGTCTQRNYVQKKAGQKAEAHHTYGALLVEVDNEGEWFVRQIVADDKGAFYDLTEKYLPNGTVLKDQRPEAINWGDIHAEKIDPVIAEAAFGQGGMLDALRPKLQVLTDLQDFTTRNHHNIKDPNFWTVQHFAEQRPTVESGISLTAAFTKAAERKDTQTLVVNGNHDEPAFRKWLSEADTRFDPANRAFWHECNAKLARELETGNTDFNVFEWAIREKANLMNTVFLPIDTSYVICKDSKGGGIEIGLHGDIGPNGGRGNPRAFRSLGRKANTGHTHSASINQGVYTAGVLGKLDMDYNKGPSSWSHSNVLTYPNGKRTIVTMKSNGKWKAGSPAIDAKALKKTASAKKPQPKKPPGAGKKAA